MLLFASLGMVVYFADHLVHSIQIDAINRGSIDNTLRVFATCHRRRSAGWPPRPGVGRRPGRPKSGYVQTIHPELLLPMASRAGVTICLRARVGPARRRRHRLGWVWAPTADDPRPDAEPFEAAVDADVRIGFERTLEQDVAFGIRQQIDIACKALSTAINDPYTAVQAHRPPIGGLLRARRAPAWVRTS